MNVQACLQQQNVKILDHHNVFVSKNNLLSLLRNFEAVFHTSFLMSLLVHLQRLKPPIYKWFNYLYFILLKINITISKYSYFLIYINVTCCCLLSSAISLRSSSIKWRSESTSCSSLCFSTITSLYLQKEWLYNLNTWLYICIYT